MGSEKGEQGSHGRGGGGEHACRCSERMHCRNPGLCPCGSLLKIRANAEYLPGTKPILCLYVHNIIKAVLESGCSCVPMHSYVIRGSEVMRLAQDLTTSRRLN